MACVARAHSSTEQYVLPSQDYRPEFHYWRLVLLSRKCCLVTITVLYKRNAMYQASLALTVLAVSYAIHAKFHAFVTADAQATAFAQEHSKLVASLEDGGVAKPSELVASLEDGRVAKPSGVHDAAKLASQKGRVLLHVKAPASSASAGPISRLQQLHAANEAEMVTLAVGPTGSRALSRSRGSRRLSGMLNDVAAASIDSATTAAGHVISEVAQLLDFNMLETALLSACIATLLAGMVFKSAALTVGGPWYTILTIIVAGVIVVSVGLFSWMLSLEIRRSCAQRRQIALAKKLKIARVTNTENPLRKLQRRLTHVLTATKKGAGVGGSIAGLASTKGSLPAASGPGAAGTPDSGGAPTNPTSIDAVAAGAPSSAGAAFVATAARRERMQRMGAAQRLPSSSACASEEVRGVGCPRVAHFN